LSVNRRFGGAGRLHLQGQRNKFSKKPANKQVASRIIRQPEIRVYLGNRRYEEDWNSVDTQRTTQRYIPEVDTLQNINNLEND
jgi:hypothetical protein